MQDQVRAFWGWAMQESHKERLRQWQAQLRQAFTEHPRMTGESYLEHLWFTVRMSLRFFFCSVVLVTHGLFPFLCVKTASQQIEKIYLIMKSRIPQARREVIEANWEI